MNSFFEILRWLTSQDDYKSFITLTDFLGVFLGLGSIIGMVFGGFIILKNITGFFYPKVNIKLVDEINSFDKYYSKENGYKLGKVIKLQNYSKFFMTRWGSRRNLDLPKLSLKIKNNKNEQIYPTYLKIGGNYTPSKIPFLNIEFDSLRTNNIDLNTGFNSLKIKITNIGFEDYSNLELYLTDIQLSKYFELPVSPVRIITMKKNEILHFDILDSSPLKNSNFGRLKIKGGINFLIKTKLGKFTYVVKPYGYITGEYNLDFYHGFYCPFGQFGGAGGFVEISEILIRVIRDNVNVLHRIDRKLDLNESELLQGLLKPEIPGNYNLKFALLDENRKRISNQIYQKYEILFDPLFSK